MARKMKRPRRSAQTTAQRPTSQAIAGPVAASVSPLTRTRTSGPWAAITVPSTGFSDVLTVTEAAVREVLAGGNPYGHGFEESFPPGAPFAYGPLPLLWYLPALDDPARLELLAAGLDHGGRSLVTRRLDPQYEHDDRATSRA